MSETETLPPNTRVLKKAVAEMIPLPQAQEAEKGVLSAMLMLPETCFNHVIKRGVVSESFYHPAHRMFFDCLMEMWSDKLPVDFVAIAQALTNRGQLERVGGPAFITDVMTFLPTAVNLDHYVDLVLEKHKLRDILILADKVVKMAYDPLTSFAEAIATMQSGGNELAGRTIKKSKTFREQIIEVCTEVCNGTEDPDLLVTGIHGIDYKLRLYRGDFLVITGGTSSGKSALASNMAVSMARSGLNCRYYPLEMSVKQQVKRALADESGYSPEFVRKSTMMATPTEMPRIQQIQKLFIEGAQRLSKYHLNVIDNVTALEEIFADVRMAHSQKPVDAVFIDYIQLMTSSQRGFDREQQFLAYASKACKSLAGELGALVATPSQVNKDGVTRGAQDVEFYANAILGIQVDEEEHRLVTINKQRDGERGVALPLDWDGRITKFISSATAGS